MNADTHRQHTAPPCQLYLITPASFDPDRFAEQLALALAGGAVAALQIRLKPAQESEIVAAWRSIAPIAARHHLLVILNDNPALAAELGCGGVHVGAEDPSIKEARRLLGGDGVIGATCKDSRHLAICAAEEGADYVAFGAFFPSQTKPTAVRADLDLLRWWAETTVVPCVAIGGITPARCSGIVASGADFLAVSGAVWNHPLGPGQAVREFHAAIQASDAAQRLEQC